jgi:mono/diheme cytochrome c family protein
LRAAALAVLVLALAGCGGVHEQHAALTQQAAWGRAVFETNCARCHAEGRSVETLSRERLLGGWRNAAQLQAFIARRMPLDRPGWLPQSDYWAVTAYLLERERLLTLRSDSTLGPVTGPHQRLGGEVQR